MVRVLPCAPFPTPPARNTYYAMLRIFKHYNFQASIGVTQKLSFSSYPGFLVSVDDFYVLGSGLLAAQS